MLDLTRRLPLAGIPGATVFGDHQDPDTFYVIPETPVLDQEDDG